MLESASGIFVFKCVVGLWGREAENAILYLYRKALILASELIRPEVGLRYLSSTKRAGYGGARNAVGNAQSPLHEMLRWLLLFFCPVALQVEMCWQRNTRF